MDRSSTSSVSIEGRGQRLRRQAYLLTGDPQRAEQLTRRALAAADLESRRVGQAGMVEFSYAQLVRSFVADPSVGRRVAGGGPAGPVSGRNGYAAVWEALAALPPRRRAVMVLRYDEGLSEEQIAGRLGSSPGSVLADVEAGLLALRARLGRGAEPAELVPAALAAAAGDWSWGTPAAPGPGAAPGAVERGAGQPDLAARDVPAGGVGRPTTVVGAAGGPTGPAGSAGLPLAPAPGGRQFGVPATALAALAVAVVVVVVLVSVPLLRGGGDPAAKTSPAAAARGAGTPDPVAAPVVRRPGGLLDWPARGRLAADAGVLPAALAGWRAGAARGQAPTGTASVLYAGPLEGRQVVLLQALDSSGRPRVAQLTGPAPTELSLVTAEALRPGTAIVSIVPPQGRTGRIRVLVAPQAARPGGLLASDALPGSPLRPATVDEHGVSDQLPSPRGFPTSSRVLALGPADGDNGRRVLESGVVQADMLTSMAHDVEVGSPTLVPIAAAAPETRWFDDGAQLARRVGRGRLVVAGLGPELSAMAPGVGEVHSRLYELRRGPRRWLGSVVLLGSKAICTSAVPVDSAGVQGDLTALIERCPVPGGMMPGLVHVLAGPGVRSVRVDLAATPKPAGQRDFTGTVERPGGVAADTGFTALLMVHEEFPCGRGRMAVMGENLTLGGSVPVYLP